MTAPSVDPAFPALHIRPPCGWLNDPNGVCRIDGRYHVFFQHNPYAPRHGAIHWGHASSTDLLRWRYEPPALVPRPGGLDAVGCWSGCVVDDAGVPTAVYTAVHDDAQHASTVLATSDRTLRDWHQGETALMSPPPDPAVSEVRDPYVFVFDGHRYAIQGAGHPAGQPRILLYGCDDLTSWTPLGTLLSGDDPVAAELAPAQIWECPNLVELDGHWALIVSRWLDADGAHLLAGVSYLLGDLAVAGDGLSFTPVVGGTVDDGTTFYAPLTLALPDRVLLWAWAAEHGRSADQVERAGWAGVLTFPRELRLSDGALVSRPAAELLALRRPPLRFSPGTGFRAGAFEVEASGPLQLRLDDTVVVDLPGPTAGATRVLVDGSLVEVFAGPTPLTCRAYPGPTTSWVLDADPATTTVFPLALPDGP